MDPGWLYLHFLDRELLTTCSLYGNLSPRRIQDDFLLSLLSITEPAYISTSVLFESDYAFDLFSRYRAVFSRHDLVRLAGTHDQLGELVRRKRSDYVEHRSRYARYFTDSWKEIEDAAPTLAVKRQDTTQFLQRRVNQRLTSLPALSGASPGEAPVASARSLIEKLKSALYLRNNAPVTPSLFEPVFQALAVQERWRYLPNLQISFAYVESYLNEYGGTIPTGLRCGLQVFDCLSRTFPLHCLDIWRDLYTTLGVYPRILAVPAEDLVQIRELDAHASFVAAARRTLASDGLRRASPATRHAGGRAYETWCVSQRLARRLPRCSFDESTSFVSFVEGVLRQASFALEEHLGEEPAIPLQSSARASPGDAVFYLDVENSALKGTDGRVIALDERVLRVLFALAGELAGPGRRQPLGKLSDAAVASLYSGERHEWEPDEAAKITYQFTRLLRRSLSRANVGERDAIVRRLREKGIAMGTRWARPAVRGRSEVGLLFGRHRDIVAADR